MKFISSCYRAIGIFDINDVEKINENDLFHRYDVFNLNEINDLFQSKGFPAVFISDHVIHFENFFPQVKFIGLPLWLERERKNWNPEEFNNEKIETKFCFNFMVNKKQINRYLCIKLVELFKFKNFTYTWSGVDNYFDCSDIIKEHNNLGELSPLNATQFGQILSPITTNPLYFFTVKKYNYIDEQNKKNKVSLPLIGMKHSWDIGCNELFVHSAVSLITESLTFQKASVFTEKTLYSILGLNFPIWVGGGNRQAEMWKKLGFDVFDDVINHDYQYYDTLLERCVYAFTLNKKILTDLDYATSMRNLHIERLENNRSLILSRNLSDYIKNELETHFASKNLDRSFRDSLSQLLKKFRIDDYQLKLP